MTSSSNFHGLLFNGIDTKKMRKGRMQAIFRSTDKAGKVKVNFKTPEFKKL